MKKITLSAVSLLLCAILFVFSGCDMSVNLNDDETTKPEPNTAIVEITNEEGTVVATQTVTMSAEEKEDGKNFFKPTKDDSDKGISKDRLENALKKEETTQKPATGDKGDSSLEDEMNNSTDAVIKNDGDILRSNQYFVTVRIEANGKSAPYKIARRGNKTSISCNYDGNNIGFILTDDKIYMLSIDEKQYVEFPKSLVEENATDEEMKLLLSNPFEVERKIVKKTTEKVEGQKYNVVIYEGGTKDYYVGDTIMMTKADDGSILYYDKVSAIAPASLFSPPKGYEKVDYEDVTVPETTAHEHK